MQFFLKDCANDFALGAQCWEEASVLGKYIRCIFSKLLKMALNE
jgi:hypothetical protein